MRGEGARRAGGRCNYIGTSAVYTSEHISLAALEVLVHLDKFEIPDDYVLMGLDAGEQRIPVATESEAREHSLAKTVPILRVPSAVVPRESNFVFYPDCPNFNVGIVFVEPFAFDARLFAPPAII